MKFLPAKKSFLSEEGGAQNPADAKAVIIPFGLERTVSYGGGTANGPQAILDASGQLEMYDEELGCEAFRKYGVATLEPEKIVKGQEAALDQLSGIVQQVLDAGKFPMVLGGEHAITAGAIKPYAKKYDELWVLHFDAHADLRDGYDGEHYSHAAALRRVLDNQNVNLVSVGIRNISAGEIPFYESSQNRVKIYFAKDKKQWNAGQIAAHFKGNNVYITFDLDGFDSSLMPATGTPEPGGLFWDEALEVIREVTKVAGKVVGADVNELAPIAGFHACNFVAAKLVYKILNYSLI